ncbi:J domain-containing protein [Hymenobacter sp. ASUV-10]|uniref:J domain-containing protein n=1 Tax=Hymenobacter aranciens TaxID=3063996 RepID=A0ABT9BBZ7_9BACT|nr:J domain-containing protein [Hymenobacter sp. ASUV-10]MDO7875791.1 J domain-containing protein [Hymenobacter sp. ASUV-10]
MSNAEQSFPSPINVPVRTGPSTGTPAQQAFQQAIQAVENLREQLRELKDAQAEARRRYWQQVGPVAAQVVDARRALYAPLEEALLLSYFNRLEERQITGFILANAQALQERFGENETMIIQKYAPTRGAAASAASTTTHQTDDAPPPHEQAAAQSRAQRKTKAQKKQEAAEQAARAEQQRLLSNTKTVYRQLARANHPDLERDPTQQQHKTALMQRITEAYEANDLYTLLQLLAEGGPADADSDDVLTRYTQALTQQQIELKQQLQALKFGPNGFSGSTGKKQELELRQLKRDLRAEAEYIQHVGRLMQEPSGMREVLRMLSDEGLETV